MSAALRAYVTTGVALVGASLIAVTPVAPPQSDVVHHAVRLTSNGDIVVAPNGVPGIDATLGPGEVTNAYLVGGSTIPVLPTSWFHNANEVYVQPNFPGAVPHYFGYPAQFYIFNATLGGYHDRSEAVGQQTMDDVLMQQLGEGHNVVFYGTSQGATLQALEMIHLMSLPADEQPSPTQLGFVDFGDPNLPDGGVYTRFGYPELPSNVMPFGLPGHLNIPSIGIAFSDPTPPDAPWPDVIYTGEYDGFGDYPQYPLNLLADFNALLGTEFVHDGGSDKPASLIATAMPWETSPGYDGDTTYFIIPTPDLPLLDPIRSSPIGNAIADLLQPDLRVLVNLGYGPNNVGWSEYPNILTPASGLFPDVNPTTVLNELVAGAKEGVQNFMTDLNGITPQSLMAAWTSADPAMTITPMDLDPSNFTSQLETVLTLNNNALTAVGTAIANTADNTFNIAEAFLSTLPQDDVNLILAGLNQLADGNMNGALTDFGEAANLTVGLGLAWAPFVELETIDSQLDQAEDAIQSAATANMDFLAGLPGLL
jgi:hypothetical protein